MKTVRLYGVLARKFGREFKLNVRTPAEAVKALCAVCPGFREHLAEFSEPGYHVRVGRTFVGKEDLSNPCAETEIIQIMPATAGSGAAVRIILGIVLIVVGVFTSWLGPVGPYAISLGISLIVGGVAELLTPKPKYEANEPPENKPNNAFDGPVNTIGQGHPVAVGYGELLVGSQVISAQMYTEEILI